MNKLFFENYVLRTVTQTLYFWIEKGFLCESGCGLLDFSKIVLRLKTGVKNLLIL